LARSGGGHPGGDPLIIHDLLTNVSALRFEPFREGIEAAWLHRDPHGGAAAAVLRYRPGARAPRHRHPGWERVILISGSQADAQGLLKAGDVALNAPGTEHEVYSEEGCVALLVWERQPIMLE
jgi:anti-sigma factor ChrR (cupin superfamily)